MSCPLLFFYFFFDVPIEMTRVPISLHLHVIPLRHHYRHHQYLSDKNSQLSLYSMHTVPSFFFSHHNSGVNAIKQDNAHI